MQMVDPLVYAELEGIANERGISVQELIRAIIVPEWLKQFRTGKIHPVKEDSESPLSSAPGMD